MKSLSRLLLTSTSLTIAPAVGVAVIPSQAAAQTVCTGTISGTQNNISCVNGTAVQATGTTQTTTVLAPVTQGLTAASVPAQTVTLTPGSGGNTISTNIAGSPGISLTSAGTVTLTAPAVNVATTGAGSTGLVLTSINGGVLPSSIGTITTTGAGSRGVVVTSIAASSPVTSTVGNVLSTDDGVVVTAGANAVTLTTGTVRTSEASAPGTTITTTGPVTFTGGLTTTTGATSDALRINGGTAAGAITATLAGASTTGADSEGVEITGRGVVNFTNSGTITTTGAGSTGILINGPITGPAAVGTTPANPSIVNCGNVTTTGADSPAVDILAAGNVVVSCGTISTAGINSDGINVVNSALTTTVTGGNTTTTGANSIGIDVATTGTGAVVINTGNVTSSGAGSPTAVRVVAAGNAVATVNATGNVTSTTGPGILASSAGAVNVTTAAGTIVQGTTSGISVSSTSTANPACVVGTPTAAATFGTSPVCVGINGTVRATNAGAPAILVTGNGRSTVVIGSTGTVLGTVSLTPGADTFANLGTFNAIGTSTFGLGADSFTNFGTGSVASTNGAAVFDGLETFTNTAGRITMVDSVANDSLTLPGNYIGNGGFLQVDVESGTAGLVADRLIIGGNASGQTFITPNFQSGTATINSTGVQIVDAATATGTPFVLAGPVRQGLIDYALRQDGGDTFLVSTPNAAVFDVVGIPTLLQDTWHASTGAVLSCAAARRLDFGTTPVSPLGICGQIYGGEERYGDDGRSGTLFGTSLGYSDKVDVKRKGAQVEFGFRNAANLSAGVTVGIDHARTPIGSDTDIDVSGWNYGAYAQFGSAAGLYGGVLAKRNKYTVRLSNPLYTANVRPDASSTGIDGEIGWRTPSFGAMLDLNAGLSHVRTKMDDFDAGFLNFETDDFNSTRGRIGARLGWASNWAPFVGAKLLHDFGGDNDIDVRSGTLEDAITSRGHGTWARFEGGFAGASQKPIVSGWVDVGDVKGFGVRAGLRF